MYISLFGMCLVVLFAAPFCVLLSFTFIPIIDDNSSTALSRSLSKALGWSRVLFPFAITIPSFNSPILLIRVDLKNIPKILFHVNTSSRIGGRRDDQGFK